MDGVGERGYVLSVMYRYPPVAYHFKFYTWCFLHFFFSLTSSSDSSIIHTHIHGRFSYTYNIIVHVLFINTFSCPTFFLFITFVIHQFGVLLYVVVHLLMKFPFWIWQALSVFFYFHRKFETHLNKVGENCIGMDSNIGLKLIWCRTENIDKNWNWYRPSEHVWSNLNKFLHRTLFLLAYEYRLVE